MNDHEDLELRGRFERLRAEEAALAPDFERMLSAAEAERGSTLVRPPRRRTVMWVSSGAGLAAAAIGGLMLAGQRADARFEEAVASWHGSVESASPTDFLLDLPGSELMRRPVLTLPTVWVGVTDSGIPMPTRVDAGP